MICKFCRRNVADYYLTTNEYVCMPCAKRYDLDVCKKANKYIDKSGFKCNDDCSNCTQFDIYKNIISGERRWLIIISAFPLTVIVISVIAILIASCGSSFDPQGAVIASLVLFGVLLIFLPFICRSIVRCKFALCVKVKPIENFFSAIGKRAMIFVLIGVMLFFVIFIYQLRANPKPNEKSWGEMTDVERKNAEYSEKLYEYIHEND